MSDAPAQPSPDLPSLLERDVIFVRAYPDEECGCPVEEWIVKGVELMIHFEPNGSTEVFADGGDWDHNFPLNARTMELARVEAIAWVKTLPDEGRTQP